MTLENNISSHLWQLYAKCSNIDGNSCHKLDFDQERKLVLCVALALLPKGSISGIAAQALMVIYHNHDFHEIELCIY